MSKETVFILKGSNLDNMDKEEILSIIADLPNVNAIDIGNSKTGFDHKNLEEMFTPHVTGQEERFNIIISMHGIHGGHKELKKDPNKYYLETEEKIIEVDEILPELIRATKGVPLTIFVTSCYGKFFQQEKYLKMLPQSSMLITLSGNGQTKLFDEHIYNQKILTLLKEVIATEGFKMEHLLKIYCLNQQVKQYNPIIGVHSKDGTTESFKVGNFIQKYAGSHNELSTFFKKALELDVFSSEHNSKLIELINSKEKLHINDFKPKLTIASLIEKLESNTVEYLKKYLEDEYYPQGSLKSLNFDKIVQYFSSWQQSNQNLRSPEELLKCFQAKYEEANLKRAKLFEEIKDYFSVHNEPNPLLTQNVIAESDRMKKFGEIIERLSEISGSDYFSDREVKIKLFIYESKLKYFQALEEKQSALKNWKDDGMRDNTELISLLDNSCLNLKACENLNNLVSDLSNDYENVLFNLDYMLISNFNIVLTQGSEAAMEYALEAIGETHNLNDYY